MADEQNPYEPPIETDPASQVGNGKPTKIDYPGGMKTVIVIGVAGGVIVGLMLFRHQRIGEDFASNFTISILIWSGVFALVGGLLPGPRDHRLARCIIAFLLSFPAIILYVPVCSAVAVAAMSSGATPGSSGAIVGSVIAFTSVLMLFAVLLRNRARRSVPQLATPTVDIDGTASTNTSTSNEPSSDE